MRRLSQHSSLEDLLEAYGQGEKAAFQLFFERTKDPIFAFIRRKIKDQAAAEDVAQESFLRVHRYVGHYRRQEGKALTWLFTIVHHSMIDYWRQHKHQEQALDSVDEGKMPSISASEDLIFYQEMLAEIDQMLSPEERSLFIKRFLEERSFEEIAEQLAIQSDNARQRFSRLTKKLKKLLSSDSTR